MSMVNADSTQLLTILKNLQNSISSIETTKNSVKLKYQQLPDSISMEQIKQVMKKCILSETDNLFELLRVTINDDYLY